MGADSGHQVRKALDYSSVASAIQLPPVRARAPNVRSHRPERATRAPVRCSLKFDAPDFRDRINSITAYRITRSARWSIVGGIVSASALAVLRLITSSNLVGC
jgi:hypothetical protein